MSGCLLDPRRILPEKHDGLHRQPDGKPDEERASHRLVAVEADQSAAHEGEYHDEPTDTGYASSDQCDNCVKHVSTSR